MEKLSGKYRICPLNYYFEETKKCLCVSRNSPDEWAEIIIDNYDVRNPSQVFSFEKIDDPCNNLFKIVTCYNHHIFDVKEYRMENGTNVIQYHDNGGGNQHWNITNINRQMLSELLSKMGYNVDKLPDSIYDIRVLDFGLTISNNRAVISKDSQDLYILEKVE